MSVKTDTRKFVAEPSLFDVFGPNVSEQVKAVNQRAAELSMDDMARIMDQTDCAVRESRLPEAVTIGQNLEFARLERFMSENNARKHSFKKYNKRCSDAYEINNHYFMGSHANQKCYDLLLKGISKAETPVQFAAITKPTLSTGLTKSTIRAQEAIIQAWSNMSHLLDKGVDGRTITVMIKYNDPKTEVPRSLALDTPVNLNAGSENFVNFYDPTAVRSDRTKVNRKHVAAKK